MSASNVPPRNVLVLGASGMLGNAVLRFLSRSTDLVLSASVRSSGSMRRLPADLQALAVPGIDVENFDSLLDLFTRTRPDVVINCIGLVKQLASADDPLSALPINALLPHRLSRLCEVSGARLIHFSTDCVFSGRGGLYKETDFPDADDLYGRSKLLGEVNAPHALTLRTSIIGHELEGARSLVGWFLAQKGPVKGFAKAVFSGLPTVEIARVLRDHVLRRPELNGLYHLSAEPIDKHALLQLVAQAYGHPISIERDDDFHIDRSLDSSRFRAATGYASPNWPELVHRMCEFR